MQIAFQAAYADPFFPEFGNNGYDVQHYDLTLAIDPDEQRIEAGKAVLTVRATAKLASFTLDLAGLEVSRVAVDGTGALFSREDGKLRTQPAKQIAKGKRFTVEVDYAGEPEGIDDPTSDDPDLLPLGWLTYQNVSYTLSEPVGSSTWYPVNDEPTDKASYRISVTVDKPFQAVSNGVLLSTTNEGSKRRFVWDQKEPMASYLAMVHVGRWDQETLKAGQGKGIPIRLYTTATTPAQTLAAFRKTPEMLAAFEKFAGPYPFRSYGSVVIDDPELYYSLETQSISTFRSGIGEATVAHELAHQWFGDSVTIAEWRDLWLAEGFATYFEYLWIFRDDQKAFNAALRQLYRDTKKAGIGPAVVSEPEEIFEPNTYDRGALTLHSLRLRVGDEKFFDILRTWHKRYAGGNATSADFIKLAVQVSKDQGVRDLLEAWLYDEEIPPLSGPEAALAASEGDQAALRHDAADSRRRAR
jgi:aminopeptidase N